MAAIVMLGAAVGLPASAHAASSLSGVTITNGDVAVDKTVTISVSGFSDPADSDRAVEVDVNSPSLPCAASADLNRERRLEQSSREYVSKGGFSTVLTWTPTKPGPFLLCAWLYDPFDTATFAAMSIPITVRAPRTSLVLAMPAERVKSDVLVPLTITAFAEVQRTYSVEVNPIGVPCGPSKFANEESTSWISEDPILGGPTTVTENVATPSDGHYHLCGYVGNGASDAAPTTVLNGPAFWSGDAKCRVSAAPRRSTGIVKITCTNTDGPISVTSKRGKKRFSTTATLTNGVARVAGRAIGLKRKTRVTVTVRAGGKRAGSRVLKVKR